MQWIFMLAGLVLGALADESLSAGLLGGLIGLALGQTLRLQGLELQNSELRKELLAFAARFEQAGVAVQERLRQLEAGRTPPNEVTEPPPAVSAVPMDTAAAPADDELVWELPDELLERPAVAASTPLPANVWMAEPVVVAPQPVLPKAAPVPREPSPLERAIDAAQAWLFGGNTVLRVGVVLLFLGLAFLLRYATEGMVVPV
ncbi:MAG: DUF2339 domain-containing protein, partial [Pseudomonas sp.]|nr:DUF2339 domain-containing protein [Pseudomonas sp.]